MSAFYLALSEFDEKARFCRSMPELDAAFQRFVEETGFANWSAILVRAPKQPDSICYIGRPNMAWAERYVEKNYAGCDAVVRVLQDSDEVVWWSSFRERSGLDRSERRLFGEARDYGIREGVSTAVRLSRGRVWMCAMTGGESQSGRRLEGAFQSAANLYVRNAYRFENFEVTHQTRIFTDAEIDILRLADRGSSLRESAEILGKAPSTVYNQVARAKERLGVKSIQELLNLLH